MSSYWTERAPAFVRSDPLAWLKLLGRKIALLWNRAEMLDTESQESHAEWSTPVRLAGRVGHFGVLVPLAFLGVLVTWPLRDRLWVLYGIFSSDRAGVRNLFWLGADGTVAVERLTESPNAQTGSAVSPDGRLLIFSENALKTGEDVMQMTLDGARRVTPLVQSPFAERNAVVSPDGRWLAYEANDSGRLEIHVRPFPEVNSGHWQVSTAGGTRPLWARSGQELIYVSPTGALIRVGVERGPSWAATTPTPLVKEGYFTIQGGFPARTYDIAADGRRFLMIKPSGSDQTTAPAILTVVQHWGEELKRLVPTN